MPWRTWRNHEGVLTEVLVDRSLPLGVAVRQISDHHRLNSIMDVNAELFNDIRIREAVQGNTQRHWAQVARIPEEIYWRWRRELGNPHGDPEISKKWKKRLNDMTFRGFRSAEGHL